jgi:hypothetical protein
METLNQNRRNSREGTENSEMGERKTKVLGRLSENPHHKASTKVKEVSRGSIFARGKNTPVAVDPSLVLSST